MNPKLEAFLQRAFANVKPTSPSIGRVIVEPDYEASWDDADATPLAEELTRLLNGQPSLDSNSSELTVPQGCRLLKKYVRRILLEKNRVEKTWVEVEPPGNWI